MKMSIGLLHRRIACMAWLLMTACLTCHSAPVQSVTENLSPPQPLTETQTRTFLAGKVHLKLGATTLSVVMKALSEQTGLQINADSYLREHRLTMYMDNISAAMVLTALCELNDWKWEIVKPGQIVIGYPQTKTPQQLTDLSLILQASMPKDFRRFIGSPGILRAGMYHPSEPVGKSNAQLNKFPSENSFRLGDQIHMHQDNLEAGKILLAMLEPHILDQKPLLYTQLTSVQQRLLVAILTLNAFGNINTHQHKLLNGILRPHQRDIANVDLFLKSGNALILGTTEIENGHTRFAGSIYRVDAPSTSDRVRFP